MYEVPDAPWIRNCEALGYPEPPEPLPTCPVCGEGCETIYLNAESQAVGCNNCIESKDAYDFIEEV